MPATSIDALISDLPRGVTSRALDEHHLPLAAWVNPHDITKSKALEYSPQKILLGALDGKLIGTDDNRHMITIAGSRAGKGVSAIVPNLIHYRGSCLVIDPKGELASITAERRAKHLAQKVCVLDPFDRTAPWVAPYKASFNPLVFVKGSPQIVENAGLIADALVIQQSNQKDPHWDESARQLLEGIILHVATYPLHGKHCDLLRVRSLLTTGTQDPSDPQKTGFQGLIGEMLSNGSLNGRIQTVAIEMSEKTDTEMASILSNTRRHTKFLDFPAMASVLRQSDFDVSALKTLPRGMSIYLCLPAGRMNTCNRWLRLFINISLEIMEQTRLRSGGPLDECATDAPVLFCMDEFAALGHMQQLETAAGQIAGFGVKLWPILQDITQLQSLYEKRWETFMGNAGTLQFFGNNDISTLEFISKRLGETTLVIRHKSHQTHDQKMGGGTGESLNTQVQALLTAEEASRYFSREDPKRRQLIIRAGKDPMVLPRIIYYDPSLAEHRYFSGQYREWS